MSRHSKRKRDRKNSDSSQPQADIVLAEASGEWSLERLNQVIDQAISNGCDSVWLNLPPAEYEQLLTIAQGKTFKLPVHVGCDGGLL